MKPLSYAYLISFVCAVISCWPFSVGWRKLNYTGSKWGDDAYVCGDAYNYIINSGQASAYFILGGILIMCAMGFFIVGTLHHSGENKPIIETDKIVDKEQKQEGAQPEEIQKTEDEEKVQPN